MSLDLNKLANKLDEALSNETSETLTKFLTDKRMSDKKQSSIDWLVDYIKNLEKYPYKTIQELEEEAKQIHKKEIIKAIEAGYVSASDVFPLQEAMDYANYYYLSRYQK